MSKHTNQGHKLEGGGESRERMLGRQNVRSWKAVKGRASGARHRKKGMEGEGKVREGEGRKGSIHKGVTFSACESWKELPPRRNTAAQLPVPLPPSLSPIITTPAHVLYC